MKDPAGGNPPVTIAVQIDVPAAVRPSAAQHIGWIRQQILRRLTITRTLVNLRQQPRGESELVGLARQGQRFDRAERKQCHRIVERNAKVVGPVLGAEVFDKSALPAAGWSAFILDLAVENRKEPLSAGIGEVRLRKIGDLE